MSSALQVIVDDNDLSTFRYGGGQWTTSTLYQWYRQTSNYPSFAASLAADKSFGTLFMTFDGTAVAFVGNTPQNVLSQQATVSIDGGTPYDIDYGFPPPPAYIQWYKTPTLPAGRHNISITHLDTTAVDYALVDVGPDTSLESKRVAVDDDNPAIVYNGDWKRNFDQFNAGSLPDGYPFGNGTHRSNTVGDTATFTFSGSGLEVYGVFSWAIVGTLGVTFTLDGVPFAQTYTVTTETAQRRAGDNEASNFSLFMTDSLDPGEHTLVINVTRSDGIGLWLDFFTYIPSFATLADMPALPSSTSSGTPSQTGTPNPSNSSAPPSGRATPVGAIAGAVVGSVALLGVLIGAFLWLRKGRTTEDRNTLTSEPEMTESTTHLPTTNPPPTPPLAVQTDRLVPLRNPAITSPISNQLHSNSSTYLRDVKRDTGIALNQPPEHSPPTTATSGPSADEIVPNRGTSLYAPSESIPPAYDTLSAVNRLSNLP